MIGSRRERLALWCVLYLLLFQGPLGTGGQLSINTTTGTSSPGTGLGSKRSTTSSDSACPVGHFECVINSALCVPQSAICNGKVDCPDESDEIDCENIHDKKYWDSFFQKRPGADVDKGETCKYKLRPEDKKKLRDKPGNVTFTDGETLGGGSGVGCHCASEKLFCHNLHLANLNMIPSEVVFLDLSGTVVDNWNLNIFVQLNSLIMSSCSLERISPATFTNLTNLQVLFLASNKLSMISPATFSSNGALKRLHLGYNRISTLTSESFQGLTQLEELDLRHNKLTGKEMRIFAMMVNLQILHLSDNEITEVVPEFLIGMERLETLSLSKNKIESLEPHTFDGLEALNHLYLSWNRIRVLKDDGFCHLRNLLNLNLNDNGIIQISPTAFSCLDNLQSLNLERNRFGELPHASRIFQNLTELQHIYFDQFWMCSWSPHVRSCLPKGDGISSVENLLDNIILRTCVWLMAVVGVVGNLFVIVSRMLFREKNRVHSFYIKNLGFADLLMGIFLLSIAFHDVSFRGEFLAHQHAWRHSLTCQVSGMLSTLSSESSVMILTLITLDRYLSIVRPFAERKNAMCPAVTIITTLWLVSFLLSYAPLAYFFGEYFGSDFYTSNGLCLPLHIHNPYDQGWEYSFFLFVVLNSIAFTFICYAYWRMLRIIQSSSLTIRSTQQKQDGMLAKRFGLVVLTDFLCWAPVIVCKTLAMSGIKIPADLYGWLAVFVLPVNSALNPVIYTLTTKMFKQQVTHLSVGFRKRLGMPVSEADSMMTSSLFYRNRISRTMTTSMGNSVAHPSKSSRMDHRRNRDSTYATSNSICVTAGANGQVHPVEMTELKSSGNPVHM